MVRKRSSRATSRSKESSIATSRSKAVVEVTHNDSDEEAKITLEKRLDDFDRQVAEKINQMEADKESFYDLIRNLYYMDQQRTPLNINKMLWNDYIKQESAGGRSSFLKNSIDTLINTAELELNIKKKGKWINKQATNEAVSGDIRRSTRKRRNVLGDLRTENIQLNATVNKKRDRKKENYTPAYQKSNSSNMMITPKFDIRTRLLPSTTRKARPGELMVSLQGSPIVSSKIQDVINECDVENLDEESIKALQLLERKLALIK